MPAKTSVQPKVGSLIRCRVKNGTYSYTTTRKVIQIQSNGKRLKLEGKEPLMIGIKDVLTVLTTLRPSAFHNLPLNQKRVLRPDCSHLLSLNFHLMLQLTHHAEK